MIIYTNNCQCGRVFSSFKIEKLCSKCEKLKYGPKGRKGTKDISGSFMSIIKNGAYKRNIDFNLQYEDIQKLLEKQNYKCVLTGLTIKIGNRSNEEGIIIYNKKQETTASIDRIDSSKGYYIDNIQFVHKYINLMKFTFNNEKFINYCKLITNPLQDEFNEKQLVSQTFYGFLNRCAKRRDININVSIKELQQIFDKQKWCCALTGLPIYISKSYKNTSDYCKYTSASVDRINSLDDYNINNIQFTHKDINIMRWDLTMKEFKYYAKLVNDYSQGVY